MTRTLAKEIWREIQDQNLKGYSGSYILLRYAINDPEWDFHKRESSELTYASSSAINLVNEILLVISRTSSCTNVLRGAITFLFVDFQELGWIENQKQ